VEVPAVAELLAVNVTTLEPVVGLVAKDAVTPLGRPEAARVTLPVNPPRSVTVTVSVEPMPVVSERLVGDAASVKPGVALVVTVRVRVTAEVSDPEVPVTVIV
jgi:hypothetical protein